MNYGFIPTNSFNRPEEPGLAAFSDIANDGAGMVSLLYKLYEKAVGRVMAPRDQFNTSSCVGQATASAVDIVTAVNIAGLGLPIEWQGEASAEVMYAGSRYEIGNKRHGLSLRGKGSHVPYAAEFACEYGIAFRKKYQNYDLTEFDPKRCNAWERSGVPDDLEILIREAMIKDWSPIKNYDECRASLVNGFPVIIGSAQGFKGQPYRDDEGFLKPRGKWLHAQVYVAVDDSYSRPGACCLNSWGTRWLGGPKRHDQPDGSYWVDADNVDTIIKRGEAVALSGVVGLVRQKLKYVLL